MVDGDTCEVVCESGYTATGSFTCSGGSGLVGFSTCIDSSDSNLEVKENVPMVSAVMRMTLDLSSISMDAAKASLARSFGQALGVDAANIIIDAITEVARRRLDDSSQRRLQGKSYDISYQVVVPDGVDIADILAKASDIGTPGSDAAKLFTDAMEAEELPVSDLELVAAPRSYTATVVLSADGGMVTPAPKTGSTADDGPPLAAAPDAVEEEGSGNTGAIVGAIVGGLVGICFCGGIIWYFTKGGSKKDVQE
jgi:hypothetical protein